ncbi:hypothetical protein [Streptomyces sp. RTd22]|uniref:hypothetical protein n=1 Tax=Streptomyces sp. RTd22 TaxID=1841249 RepID=UPI001F1F3AAC|nr:hypothetical protein [Streptomyces sp. RTd22]
MGGKPEDLLRGDAVRVGSGKNHRAERQGGQERAPLEGFVDAVGVEEFVCSLVQQVGLGG